MKRKLYIIAFSVGLSLCAGFIGSYFTYPAIDSWYANLNKPFFNPPNWIFAPVWTTLYILIGFSLYKIITSSKNKYKRKAYYFFMLQLFLNAMWSIVFFGIKSFTLSILVIVMLWFSIVITMWYFNKIDKVSFWLLVPYLMWVSFATILNISISRLN